MKLTKCELNELNLTFRSSDNHKLLEQFIDSKMECAEVEGFTQKTAASCANSLNASIKRYGFNSIKAVSRGNKVYLIRKQSNK